MSTTGYVSALDLFSVGIGPSSSHTVGPMRAGRSFAEEIRDLGLLADVGRVETRLFGSLAATGLGHGTPDAVLAGLEGLEPETCDPAAVRDLAPALESRGTLRLLGESPVPFARGDLVLAPLTRMPEHTNALSFEAFDGAGSSILRRVYFSVGGGFVVRQGDEEGAVPEREAPLGFASAADLLAVCDREGLSIAGVARINEEFLHGEEALDAGLDDRWSAMESCIETGLATGGVMPGWMKVPRRAHDVATHLRRVEADGGAPDVPPQWLQAFALAVNEENASGGRVVTAPTNGAAGIIPAVGHYAGRFLGVSRDALVGQYLLTAAVVGSLYKRNASISGAEAGCQGEVGTAASMAAAGLCAVLGGTPRQVENAAEIAMEHHLGLTCDPVGGFVQVPCIERNAIAAGTAVSAARLALLGTGEHFVSLDTVIETMRQTGRDMSTNYKETSAAGLAVNIVEC
ncbi:L-serine dehydratase 1 [Frondihabitans sp. 762G35]|uniref:L-serine ammonia-lyase n=1 Tax=Frondihabitans sp. 762G35 TaxID=1446794 RepID=UPI000D213633|nr:L-serine ammonia-lyase [Frondihabitans sp. 762G35]ARC57651.1 L-serine dehydratase 1 [Frondihabitans sp. 762G35]